MRGFVREHTGLVTAVLTVLSLALVFGAVFEVGGNLLPRAPDAMIAAIPHVNALLSTLAIVVILAGLHAIRNGEVDRHRRRMLTAFFLFVTFLLLYLYRVTLEGPATFGGPLVLKTYVYYPILTVHVSLAIVCLPLLYYVLSLAYAVPVSEIPSTSHGRVGRVAALLWLVSFVLGIVVYAMLYLPLPW